MRVGDVPWEELTLGQVIEMRSITDRMKGTIVALEQKPLIWIEWHDGNRHQYTQSTIQNALLCTTRGKVRGSFDKGLSERTVGDPEGE